MDTMKTNCNGAIEVTYKTDVTNVTYKTYVTNATDVTDAKKIRLRGSAVLAMFSFVIFFLGLLCS